MSLSPEKIGLLTWIVWVAIGVVSAVVSRRFMPYRQMLVFNIIIAVVAACIGGYLSVQFVGATPMMMFFISILGAIFGAGVMLWIVAALTQYFSNRQ